jgi:hypothetical protein
MQPKINGFVAIYRSHDEAERAVKELQTSGFNMRQLSIVGHDAQAEEHVIGYYNVGERVQYWGKVGIFWGGIWGLLFGSAFFLIPGAGPFVVAGPLVAAIIGALEGAVVVGGLSAIGAGLVSLGIPEDSVVQYESVLRTGKYVLIAHGTAEDVEHARELIHRTDPESMAEHHLKTSSQNLVKTDSFQQYKEKKMVGHQAADRVPETTPIAKSAATKENS